MKCSIKSTYFHFMHLILQLLAPSFKIISATQISKLWIHTKSFHLYHLLISNSGLFMLRVNYLILSEPLASPPKQRSFYSLEGWRTFKVWWCDMFHRCILQPYHYWSGGGVCSPCTRSPALGSSLSSPAESPAASWQTWAQSRSVEQLIIRAGVRFSLFFMTVSKWRHTRLWNK